jgi:hypothetical protein
MTLLHDSMLNCTAISKRYVDADSLQPGLYKGGNKYIKYVYLEIDT